MLTVTGDRAELTKKYASKFIEAYKLSGQVSINVKDAILEHVGLGSGTQLALAVATVIAKLYNVDASVADLAVAMGRTAQSGVGAAVFAHGGLVVDAGKNLQDPNQKSIPLICLQPFPKDWRFVVAIPNVQKGLSNQAEASAFQKLPPMPPVEVGKICRLILLKLLPSIPEENIKNFGEAMTQIQCIVGDSFASAQGGRYSSSPASKCIEFMLANGVYGAGQSSWGPTVYGLVKRSEAADMQRKVRGFLDTCSGGQVFVSKVINHGATVKVSNNP
jgi:beta-RFAP synthase